MATAGGGPSDHQGESPPNDSDRQGSLDEKMHSPERVTMLSDGVFAIVLTILVLELKVPHGLPHKSLGEAIHELRPTFLAWIVSFLITGMYWVAHRDVFARVRTVNRDLVWLNLLFLLPCALIPFASSVLGEYPDDSKAIEVYGIVVIVVSVVRLILYWYIVHHPALLWPGSVSDRSALGIVLGLIPVVIYVIAIAVSFASPTVSVILFLSVPALYFLAVTIARDQGGKRSEADDFS